MPSIILSGLAKYTYSKIQNAGALLGFMLIDLNPCLEISTISPGLTSRTNLPPKEGNAQDSEETTNPCKPAPLSETIKQ